MLPLTAGALVTRLGCLAPWWPQIEIINHFRPFIVVGTGALLIFYGALQSRKAAVGAGLLLTVNLVLLLAPLHYQAPQASPTDSGWRVATLNTWIREGQTDRIAEFLGETQADIVLLQEVGRTDRATLIERLRLTYPHAHFDPRSRYGPALLSKKPWVEAGVLAAGRPQPIAVWARFEDNGRLIEVASVHAANPLEAEAQARDVDDLIAFVLSRDRPVILGGDLNLTRYSWKLMKLAHQTGLRWVQTFAASWPAHWWRPFVLIDHILVPKGFAVIRADIGPNLGPDHLPAFADVTVSPGGANHR